MTEPLTLSELMDSMPQTGHLTTITVRPQRMDQPLEVDAAEISIEDGLLLDHYSKKKGNRQITLIQAEHLSVVGNILGKLVSVFDTRRNLLVSGINLLAMHNRRFSIGEEVILEGTGYCEPCSRMEANLGPGGFNAMRGHGGITAKVVQGGKIRKGDLIRLIR